MLDDDELEEVNDPGSFAGEEADEESATGNSSAAALAGSAAAEEADADAMTKAGLEEKKKPDGDGDGVPPWADKDDDDADVQEENLDSLIDAIAEKLTVDMGATLSGWAGRSSESMKWEIEKALAHRRSTDVEEELKDLKKAQEELVFENNQLTEHNSQYKQAIEELKESTVEAAPKRGPQSLSEAIGSRYSVIRATRKESTPHDPFSDRMKRLAGIE